MKKIELGKSGLKVPQLAVGCMRLNLLSDQDAEVFLNGCLEIGANFFDHACVYANGECESIFGRVLKPTAKLRDQLILQSKVGIRLQTLKSGKEMRYYDFSKQNILSQVDGILERLKTDYLDVLLLHRPDPLVEPQEVAEAFDSLKAAGKVRHFGVSNQNPSQMQLLQKWLKMPLVANQLQMSVVHANMIQVGTNVNTTSDEGIMRDGGVLDFCRLHDITIQAWSPFQSQGVQSRVVFMDNADFAELNAKMQELAEQKGVTKTAIAISWLVRHPASIQPITGTTKLDRVKQSASGVDVVLTKEEWYELYLAGGNTLLGNKPKR